MNMLITGGGGFVGSHAAEYFAKKGFNVICYDNLSRAALLKKETIDTTYNWKYLKDKKNIQLIKGDIRDFDTLNKTMKNVDIVLHTAAQTAVTTSVVDPRPDFEVNALGTFNVLEAARANNVKSVLYCSTNKVYGDNGNNVGVIEKEKRYIYEDAYKKGLPETFFTDLCEHTPYGCSKFTGDIYCQDYAELYGLQTGVFRMSCIYGTRQFGVEDQGWIAWITIASLLDKPITIYGDGKQVRDVLYVSDLIKAYDAFINQNKSGVFNLGGGPANTLSLIELIELLEKKTDKNIPLSYADWRPSDQKVFIADISKAQKELGWSPKTTPEEGVNNLVDWINNNKAILERLGT